MDELLGQIGNWDQMMPDDTTTIRTEPPTTTTTPAETEQPQTEEFTTGGAASTEKTQFPVTEDVASAETEEATTVATEEVLTPTIEHQTSPITEEIAATTTEAEVPRTTEEEPTTMATEELTTTATEELTTTTTHEPTTMTTEELTTTTAEELTTTTEEPKSKYPIENPYMRWQLEDALLKGHNSYRMAVQKGWIKGQPSSWGIGDLYWNTRLAMKAQKWADQCTFAHDNDKWRAQGTGYSRVGQNVGWTPSAWAALRMWFEEHKDYTYGNLSCKPGKECGHYTQVVWSQTYDVGCGWKYCPYWDQNVKRTRYNMITVCNYGPAGNTKYRKPYYDN